MRPRLMRELLGRAVARQEDMELVGEVVEPLELLLAVRRHRADVVVLDAVEIEEPGIVSHLMAQYPHLVVLTLAVDRQAADLYRRVLVRERLEGGSVRELLAALRRVCGLLPLADREGGR